MAPVHANLEVFGHLANGQLALLQFERPRKLVSEILEPGLERELFGTAGIAPRELQHVFDDMTDAARMSLDDLRKPDVVGAEPR